MTTYLSPGVYIEELPSGPQPIAAASPSVLAIVGTTQRGPVGEPTRVTGWGEYVERFGGSVPGLFTAEAIAAFFENGGPAAYIVRVDPSLPARWTARTSADGDAFTIEASSPGAWANGVAVSVIPWLSGGVGRPWIANGSNAAGTTVDVDTTTGLALNDTISTIDGAATATVDTITGSTLGLTVTAGAIGDFDAQLMIVQNAATVRLATNPGVEVGDVLEIQVPGAVPTHETVAGITTGPAGTTVDLDGALALPGGAVAARTARYRARLTNPGLVQANLGHFDFEGRPSPNAADMVDGMRAHFENGLIAEWDTDHFELPDTASGDATRLPVGSVEIEGPIRASVYQETGLSIDNPTLETLATQFSWVPDGLRLELFAGGASEATIEKDGTDFTLEAGGLGFVFDEVRYDANGTTEAIVTAPFPVLVGDTLDLDAGDQAVTAVASLGGDRYHITLAGGTANQGAFDVLTAFQQSRAVPYRFAIVVAESGSETRYENLALPDTHSRYFARDGIVNEESPTIRVIGPASGTDFADMPVRADQVQLGANAVAGAQDLADGFDLLEAEPEPALLICPDALTLGNDMLSGSVIGAIPPMPRTSAALRSSTCRGSPTTRTSLIGDWSTSTRSTRRPTPPTSGSSIWTARLLNSSGGFRRRGASPASSLEQTANVGCSRRQPTNGSAESSVSTRTTHSAGRTC